MAKVAAIAWLPRSYIHLFETFRSLDKIDLDIEDPLYAEDEINFTIKGYKDYPDINFIQGWSGLHIFIAEFDDLGIHEKSKEFLQDMQNVLINKILKATHTVSYKQIIADIMSLDFHVVILTAGDIDTSGYTLLEAGNYQIAYKPEKIYTSGNITFVMGIPDDKLFVPLLYHAYAEVACDFMFNLMKAMIRLYHEADSVVVALEQGKDMASMKMPMDSMDAIVKESSERYGKLRQILLNFKLKESEFYSLSMDPDQKSVADALRIPQAFKRLEADGSYMSVLWSEILEDRLKNIDSTMNARVMMHTMDADQGKKSWF